MENILTKHKESAILYKSVDEDLVLFAPTKEQKEILKKRLIDDNYFSSDRKDLDYQIEIIRFIFNMLVKNGDSIEEMNNEELINAIEDGDIEVQKLIYAINKLVGDIQEEVIENAFSQIRLANNTIKLARLQLEQDVLIENQEKMKELTELVEEKKLDYIGDAVELDSIITMMHNLSVGIEQMKELKETEKEEIEEDNSLIEDEEEIPFTEDEEETLSVEDFLTDEEIEALNAIKE